MVSTQEPGRRRSESENGDSLDSIVNGDLEVNVDIEMDNEAFGIDSGGEIAPSSAAAAAPVVTAEPIEPSPAPEEEQARNAVAVTEEPEVSKEAADEVAATPVTEPAAADQEEESKEGPVGGKFMRLFNLFFLVPKCKNLKITLNVHLNQKFIKYKLRINILHIKHLKFEKKTLKFKMPSFFGNSVIFDIQF